MTVIKATGQIGMPRKISWIINMGKNLVIVESPAKARTLSKFLGQGYSLKASLGHIRDLPRSRLGIDIENDFEPKYVVPRKKNKIVR